MQFCSVQKSFDAYAQEYIDALTQSAQQAAYIRGPQVFELEDQLAAYIGTKHVLSCASGTDALVLSLRALGVGPNDAVLCPAYTFFASAEAISIVGACPVFVDVDMDTFNISPESLEATIQEFYTVSDKTLKAVVVVDLFGRLADYEKICEIAHKYKLYVVEDFAQAFGAKSLSGRRAGSFGTLGATSFFPTKPLACFGDGGAVCCESDEQFELMKSLAVHGKGKDKYDNVLIGMNSRLDTLQAAVLLVKLKHFSEELKLRQNVAKSYSEQFEQCLAYNNDLLRIPCESNSDIIEQSSWAQYTICLREPHKRDALRDYLAQYDIPTMVYYERALSEMKIYKGTGRALCPLTLEHSNALSKSVISLPFDPYISTDQIVEIVGHINTFLLQIEAR